MAMFFISENFLKNELDKKPEELTSEQKLYYSMIEKELIVLQNLNVELCDITGTTDEVKNRLENKEIVFLGKGELEYLNNAVKFRNDFVQFVNSNKYLIL